MSRHGLGKPVEVLALVSVLVPVFVLVPVPMLVLVVVPCWLNRSQAFLVRGAARALPSAGGARGAMSVREISALVGAATRAAAAGRGPRRTQAAMVVAAEARAFRASPRRAPPASGAAQPAGKQKDVGGANPAAKQSEPP